ncbi:MAG: hypothetical protein QOE37_643 [Microbacteriaceae bacterium]|nr:hypothetical protein [Microbacteriaceae bacterium]
MALSDEARTLLQGRAICYLATTMPDGSPQLTQVWGDTDGDRVLVNSVVGHQKVRNIERDPRVALTVSDPDRPTRFVQIRGTVVATSTEGGAEHIEALAQKYTGRPYAWYGGREQQRIILTIEPRRSREEG